MSHFPTPSPKPSIAFNEIIKSSESRIRGKLHPTPIDGHISLSSIFSTVLYKKEFPIDSAALIQNGRMGLTFRQFDDMSRRVAKILGLNIAQINRNLNPQIQNFQEAPSDNNGDVIIGILTDENHLDERLLVYVLAILKLGAGYVHVQKDQLRTEEDWKLFVRRVQPLMVIQFDSEVVNDKVETAQIRPPDFILSKVICQMNTDAGKQKLPLPYFIRKSTQLWEESLKFFNGKDEIIVVPLKLKAQIGHRTAIVFSNFIPGNGIKWIRIGHRIIHNRIHFEKMEFSLAEKEKFYMTYPISDPRSLVQLFLPLCIGKPVQLLDPNLFHGQLFRNPTEEKMLPMHKLLDEIASLEISRLSISPQHLEELLKFAESNNRKADLSSIRLWIVSGGHFPLELGYTFFQAVPRKCALKILYGSPEVLWAATWVSYSSSNEIKRRCVDEKICLGIPLHNMLVSIIDDKNWKECSSGAKGEVFISTHGMGTDAMNFIQTGDLGRIVKDRGLFKVLILEGKTNTRVKVMGTTIDLLTLGQTFEKNHVNDVKQAIVFVAPRTKDSQTVVVAYVPKCGLNWQKKAILEKAIKKVEPLINSCLEVESIPYLPNEQVDFLSLRKLYHEYLTSDSTDWSILLRDGIGDNAIQPKKEQVECAKILVKSIATSIGKEVPHIVKKLNESFSTLVNLFGDKDGKDAEAIRAVRTLYAIQNQGCILTAEDFIMSVSIKDVLERMTFSKKKHHIWKREVGAKKLIRCQPLGMDHWNAVINLLKVDFDSKATMFSSGSLERYWKRALDDVMKMGLSVVAFCDNTMVGCALNYSTFPRSEYVPVGMNKIFGLIQTAVDSSKAETLNRSEGNMILKSFYIAVTPEVFDNGCWKLVVVRDLLEASMHLGQRGGNFGSYLVCTANPLIQEVATCILGYRPLLELPMNRYKTSNFEKPFWDKDDHEKIGVYFNPILKNKKTHRRSSSSSAGMKSVK